MTVYPRVCGGTNFCDCSDVIIIGLSPRVRGNRIGAMSAGMGRGSIPACAGEPHSASLIAAAIKVYPRVCGGTNPCSVIVQVASGLSPRVRGNRAAAGMGRAAAGSIPACAGEPPGALLDRARD